ncbi:MAG: polyketide synthase dehydratase domain-containing protein, partial [Actinomycetota bacterium]
MSPRQRVFERRLRFTDPFIEQHRLSEVGVLPAAVEVEMALAAMLGGTPLQPVELANVAFQRAVTIRADTQSALRLTVTFEGDAGPWSFRLESAEAPESEDAPRHWTPVSSGEGGLLADALPTAPLGVQAARELSPAAVYARFHARGITYGPDFRSIRSLRVGAGGALATVALPADARLASWYLHPLLLDGVLQVVSCAVQAPRRAEDLEVYIPVGIERLRLSRPMEERVQVEVAVTAETGEMAEANVVIRGSRDETLATLRGVRMKRRFSGASQRRPPAAPQTHNGLSWELDWQPVEAGAERP